MYSPQQILSLVVIVAFGLPTLLFAQGGAPVQPELIGSPVPAGPSVNEFTGGFSYGMPVLTIPGPYGSSYTLTLSYRAESNPEAEPSWVGYGWSLNTGAIVREKRGFPDDWDGQVVYSNKQPVDYTVSSNWLVNAEIASGDVNDDALLNHAGLTGGYSSVQRYNSRTGYGDLENVTAGVSLLGNFAGFSYTNDNGDGSWEPILAPNILSTKLAGSILQGSNLFRDRELNLNPPAVLGVSGRSNNSNTKFGIGFGTVGVMIGVEYGTGGNLTRINSEKEKSLHGYGYLRSADALSADESIMDYYYENDVPYLLDDELLPIPFSNADVFSITGGGSFRAHSRNVGGFRQNESHSNIDIRNSEWAFNILGAGKRWGIGDLDFVALPWDNPNAISQHSFTNDGDEPWFFRYYGDMGGSLLYDNNDDPIKSALVLEDNWANEILDVLRVNDADRYPVVPGNVRLQLEDWERPGRSGYIGYTLHGDMLEKENGQYYRSYNRAESNRTYDVKDRHEISNQIGEFALYGTGGSRYVYGLPVYAKNERSYQLGLKNIARDSATNVHHNSLAYSYTSTGTAPSVSGQKIEDPYAVAWLLTSITTPDYVDLTGDGPTDDDLGGWTKFQYWRFAGNRSKTDGSEVHWQYWRQPFRGLSYNPGELSDPDDDLGSFSDGLREMYFPRRIETKTHVALFHMNDYGQNPRADAYLPPSFVDDEVMAFDSTLTSATYDSEDNPPYNNMRFLEKVELYTKGDNNQLDSLLATVHFEYDYSLRPNMPNSLPVHPDSTTRHGMLTLRKVWAERLDVKNARIAPYIFGYEYKKSTDYSVGVNTRYPEITSFADSLSSTDENPPYSAFDMDPWGNYRPGMAARHDKRFPWVPQNDTSHWDPAAWQLKWVKLPAGGEVHVQYEGDEYAFVHDRPALAMVSLIEEAGDEFGQKSKDESHDNKYYLNLNDIGVDSTSYEQVAKVRELLEKLKGREKKAYFRFLYALKGDSAQLEDPIYNSEYIDGYADLLDIDIDIINENDPDEWYALYVTLIGKKDGSVHKHGVPLKVCYDYVRKRKRGKLGRDEGVANTGDEDEMIDALDEKYIAFVQADYCKDIDYAHSYIRVPMITPKKGGGLRVKRLLSYDPAIEGDSALYGIEYHYEMFDQERNEVLSSGVASNEPSPIRDENPLVTYLAREEDDEVEGKVIAGRDRVRNEGPIGESLLPSAFVGYSRIATHPIHQGATTTGFGVTDYFTYRDFPFDARYEGIGNAVEYTFVRGDDFRPSPFFSNLLFWRQSENLVYRTQGYRFVMPDMSGRLHRQMSNGGLYTPDEDDWLTGASVEYTYFSPGDSIPLLYAVGDSIRYGYPGKEMEVVYASRKNGAYIDDWKIEADAGWIYASGMAYYSVDNSELSTHVTSKVVTYPAIVKGVRTYADGNYNYVETVAFDPKTGQPAVTRSRDSYDGLVLNQSPGGHEGAYHSYSISVVDIHPEFAHVAGNEGAIIASVDNSFEIFKAQDGGGRTFLDFPGGSETRWMQKMTPGDLIELKGTSGGDDAGRYHVDEIEGNIVWLLPSGLYNETNDPALGWNGMVNVEVIQSGRENAPTASIGGVMTYGETAEEVAAGANFAWSGPGATARLAFVSKLNTILALGSGTIDSTDAPTLEFQLPITEACGTLAFHDETYEIATSGNLVLVGSPDLTTPAFVDTLAHLGLGGWFALNDAGQIVFRSVGNLPSINRWRGQPGSEQRVLNFTFCGDDPAFRSVTNVIASSATYLSDTVDWDGNGLDVGANKPNAYEKGERGRWGPRTAFVYRTDVTGGSQPVAGERVYKDAGVYSDFSLFNWREPSQSDWDHWMQLGSITGINKQHVPYSSIDMLDRSSITGFGYGEDSISLPIYSAWNAEEGTVFFESFETYTEGDLQGGVRNDDAHSGRLSYVIDGGDTAAFAIELVVNQHLKEKGVEILFWQTNGYSTKLFIEGVTAFTLTSSKIVDVDGWALRRTSIDESVFDTWFTLGDTARVWFYGDNSPSDSVWIDDLHVKPMDAGSTGYVYDPETFRSIAVFDNKNFGLYPQYNAEGRAIRTIVETSRGKVTVAESHTHIPGATRDWLGEGSPLGSITTSGGGSQPTSFQSPGNLLQESSSGPTVNLFDLHLDKQGGAMKFFGIETSKLREALEKQAGEFNQLNPSKVRLLNQYEKMSTQYQDLQEARALAETPEEQERIDNEMRTIEGERDRLIRQLDIER